MKRVVFFFSLALMAACAKSPQGNGSPSPATGTVDSTRAPASPSAAPLSPADSASAVIAGDTVQIRYSSPAMRGRTIFGGLVPFGQVWRTGANAATSFVTTTDVVINGISVPKGRYTLYSIPERAADGSVSWQLIVNKQVGQWGTEYHPEMDLVRIPLKVSSTTEPVERFDISLEPSGEDRATLALEWERTRGTADVVVKR
ncbi:MAG TPA: DUF2911 domain-containing protein [Gemmatimonadaceae bacterium]|nr:DUF2911 domain-containing protein [Gemmatimonadaceae bacterium]